MLGLVEQLLSTEIALQDFEAESGDREEFIEEGLFLVVEAAEGGDFKNAEHHIFGFQGSGQGLNRGGVSEAGGNAEITGGQAGEGDGLLFLGALANQAFADGEGLAGLCVLSQTVGGNAPEAG